jgi:ABC-type sugar transport system ATPase subunit
VIGLRPGRLGFLPDGAPTDRPVIQAPAVVVEPLGSETLVTLDLAGHAPHVKVPPGRVRRSGERVRLAMAPDSVHLFDRGTGRRL